MLLIMWSFRKRCNVYEAFVTGAKDALPTLVQILPYMAAMLIAISVFRASGAMDLLMGLLSPAFEAVGMPAELVPLVTPSPVLWKRRAGPASGCVYQIMGWIPLSGFPHPCSWAQPKRSSIP